jgi:hypothetical protein
VLEDDGDRLEQGFPNLVDGSQSAHDPSSGALKARH